VKGYVIDEKNTLFSDSELLNYFKNCSTIDDIKIKLNNISGLFTIICFQPENFFIINDIVRMFPLFYYYENNSITLSDNIENVKNNILIDNEQEKEIYRLGYNLCDSTLYDGIKQIQASEIIYFSENTLKKEFYFTYLTSKLNYTSKISDDIIYKTSYQKFTNAFISIKNNLEGNTPVVPLSGGFDSRLIAVLLKIFGFTNVICYTYGKKGGKDIEISREVANRLGFKWYYIEYNYEIINKYLEENLLSDYFSYLKKNISFPFFQEYYAVMYLIKNNLIPENSVFLPGHSGDFLGGS